MVQSIVAVQSQAGSGLITFDVNVDANGCDENFSATIDGTKFSNHVKHGAADNPGASIQTSKGGQATGTFPSRQRPATSLRTQN